MWQTDDGAKLLEAVIGAIARRDGPKQRPGSSHRAVDRSASLESGVVLVRLHLVTTRGPFS